MSVPRPVAARIVEALGVVAAVLLLATVWTGRVSLDLGLLGKLRNSSTTKPAVLLVVLVILRSRIGTPTRSRWVLAAALAVAIYGGFARTQYRSWWVPVIPVAEAGVAWVAPFQYQVKKPGWVPGEVRRLGPVPTPVSRTLLLETASGRLSFLFETLGKLRVVFDGNDGAQRSVTMPESQLAYSALVDRSDPQVIWIAGAVSATVFRLDLKTMSYRVVHSFPGESHLFSIDQAEDGTLLVGAYPGGAWYQLRPSDIGANVVRHLPPVTATEGRPYVHGVFSHSDGALLHLGSPGLLLNFDQASGGYSRVMTGAASFLSFSVHKEGLTVGNGTLSKDYDRSGREVDSAETWGPPRQSTEDGEAAVSDIALRPANGGMGATTILGLKDGKGLGGTYWNHWVYEVDSQKGSVRGLGPLPKASGEFYALAETAAGVVIPNYQGQNFLLTAAERGDSSGPTGGRFRALPDTPGLHFATAAVPLNDGTVVWATAPNYKDPGGALVRLEETGGLQTIPVLPNSRSLGHLVKLTEDYLVGATSKLCGLGVPAAQRVSNPTGLMVIRQDPLEVVSVSDLAKDLVVVGLTSVDTTKILLVTADVEVREFLLEGDSLRPGRSLNLGAWGTYLVHAARLGDDALGVLFGSGMFVVVNPRSLAVRTVGYLPKEIFLLTPLKAGKGLAASRDALYGLGEGLIQGP